MKKSILSVVVFSVSLIFLTLFLTDSVASSTQQDEVLLKQKLGELGFQVDKIAKVDDIYQVSVTGFNPKTQAITMTGRFRPFTLAAKVARGQVSLDKADLENTGTIMIDGRFPLPIGIKVEPIRQLTDLKVMPKKVILPRCKITSFIFNSIVSDAFRDAYYRVNTCGGTDSERKTRIYIPTVQPFEERLDRLHYNLTEGENRHSEWKLERKWATDIHYRRKMIRACVDSWESLAWEGSIEGGKFKIVIKFHYPPHTYPWVAIKTRAIDESKETGMPFWQQVPDSWGAKSADDRIPDYQSNEKLEVFLTPKVEGGKLTYSRSEVVVKWNTYEFGFESEAGDRQWRLPALKTKVEEYRENIRPIIIRRIKNAFLNNEVRNLLADALSNHIHMNLGVPVASIDSVSGSGSSIVVEVTFQ